MLRSPWFWLALLLIAAGIAVTAALGVFVWFAWVMAVALLILDGILLYSAYAIRSAEPPTLRKLKAVADEDRIPVIYDCDLTMGCAFRDVGDGLALLYLLGEPGIDLQLVTTTYGNGPVGMTTRSARRLLNQVGREDLTVVRGADDRDDDPGQNEAAQRLVGTVNARPRELVVFCTGALTNLKHAQALDPDFFRKLRSLYLVGGVTDTLFWKDRRLEERNFSLDPEAAYQAILTDCPTTITLGQAGLTAVLRGPQLGALKALDDPVSDLIVRPPPPWLPLPTLRLPANGLPMWEPVAAVAMTHPEYLDRQRVHLPTTVEDLRTGRLVTDPHPSGPVRLIQGVEDYESFIKTLFAGWHHLGQSLAADKKGRE